MNCPQCNQAYSCIQPAMVIPHCGDSYCLKCLTAMECTFGGVWCPSHPPIGTEEPSLQMQPESFLQDSDSNQRINELQSSNLYNLNLSGIKEDNSNSRDQLSNWNLQDSIRSMVNNNTFKVSSSRTLRLEDLRINHTIMNLTNSHCQIHNEQKTLFCLNDGCYVCQKCAIFGLHKGHQILLNESIEQTKTKIKKDLKKQIHYLFEKNTLPIGQSNRANQFLQSLKSENSTRKDQIAKWLHKTMNKVTHKIEKEYNDVFQTLKKQKQTCLKEVSSRIEELLKIMSELPQEKVSTLIKLEKDLTRLQNTKIAEQYLWYEKKNSTLEKAISTKNDLKLDLVAKIIKFDTLVNSFQIERQCYFQGSFKVLKNSSQNLQMTNNSELLQFLRRQEEPLLLQTPRDKALKSHNSINAKKSSHKYQPEKPKILQKNKERKVKTSENMATLKEDTSDRAVQIKLIPFKQKTTSIRFSRENQHTFQERCSLKRDSSIVSVRKGRNYTRSRSANKTVIISHQTVILQAYPDSKTLQIPSTTRQILANGVLLDNFKAIEIVKKSIANGAKIRKMDLSNNKLTNKFLEFLAEIPLMKELKQVDLGKNRLELHLAGKQLAKLEQMGIMVKLE